VPDEPGNRAARTAGVVLLGLAAVIAALIIFGVVIPIATSGPPDHGPRAIQACRDEVRGQLGSGVDFDREAADRVNDGDVQVFQVAGKATAGGAVYTFGCRVSVWDSDRVDAVLTKLER
jgi:hypothetical protein